MVEHIIYKKVRELNFQQDCKLNTKLIELILESLKNAMQSL